MEFHDLEVFLIVAKERSFSKAARKVFRTQPAVSLAIKRLEDELESHLFDKVSREPVLTDIGKSVAAYAEQILSLRKDIHMTVSEIKNLKKGKVKIGANEIGAIYLLPHIANFAEKYPEIELEVMRCRSRDIPDFILQRQIDLGILAYDPMEQDIQTDVVYQDRMVLVVYPEHPFAKKKKVAFSQLGDQHFAAHNVDSGFRLKTIEMFQEAGVRLNIKVELPTIDSIKEFVMLGKALALVPRMSVESAIKAKSLVEVEVAEFSKLQKKLRVVYLKSESRSAAPKIFVQELVRSKNVKP